jgi:hypothetical protein
MNLKIILAHVRILGSRSPVRGIAFPKWESLKNKSGKSGVFFGPEK